MKRFGCFLVLAGMLALGTTRGWATTYTWTNGAASGNWDDASKWYGGAFPPYAPDNVANLENLPNGNTVSMNGNRQIGHLVFSPTLGNNQYIYYSAAANTLDLSCTTGQPTILNGGLFRVIITGTNGFIVDAGGPTRDSQFWAGSTNASSYNTVSGTVRIKSGRFHVRLDGSFYNIGNIEVNNGTTLYLYHLRDASYRGIEEQGHLSSNVVVDLRGGGTLWFQAAQTDAVYPYNEYIGTLRNSLGASLRPRGTINFDFQNSGGKLLSIGRIAHDTSALLNINAGSAWNDTTFRLHVGSADMACGTAISNTAGTSIIPYAVLTGNGRDGVDTFAGVNTNNDIRDVNWNVLGSTSTTWVDNDNAMVTTGGNVSLVITRTGAIALNALRFNSTGYKNLALNNSQITLASGVLSLYSRNYGWGLNGGTNSGYNVDGNSTITSGTNELFVYTINTVVAGNNIWRGVSFVDGPAGPVRLTKANGGGLIFYGSKSNTWSGGTTISEGWINMRDPLVEVAGSGSQLGLVPTSFSPNNVVIYDGAKLINDQVNTLHANRGIGVIGNSYIVATYGALTLNGPIGDYTNIVGNVIFDCTGAYNVNAGWILGGASTYSGTTTVNGAWMKLAGNNRLPVTTPLYINGANTTYPPLFDLAGYSQSLAGLFGGTNVVKGTITNSTGTSMLTLTGASDFDGALRDGGAGSGKYLALTVAATNKTVTFTGADNRIVGAAAITGGTLNLSSNGLLTAGATTFGPSTGLGLTLTPVNTAARLTVNGNLDVSGAALTLTGTPAVQTVYTLATYSGTLNGSFAAVTGLPAKYTLDYGTGNNSSIRLRPPVGTVILIR